MKNSTDTDLKKQRLDEFTKLLSDLLDSSNNLILTKTESGFETDIYADYRDELSNSTIKEILEAEHPMDYFYDLMSEWYWESEAEEINEILEACKEETSLIEKYEQIQEEFGEIFTQDFEDFLRDNIQELVSVNYPYDHYLKQDTCTDIFIDYGDANYDFTCNNILNYYGDGAIDQNSSIAWLCEQQGKKELFEQSVKEATEFEPVTTTREMTDIERLDRLADYAKYLPRSTVDVSQYQGLPRDMLTQLLASQPNTREWATVNINKLYTIANNMEGISKEDHLQFEDMLEEWETKFGIDATTKEECEFPYYVDTVQDKFVKSVVQELENLPSHMGILSFCVSMKLNELIDINQKIKNNENFIITIDKSATCGLYDIWSGGGSTLEIELEKDVEIPSSMIYKVCEDHSLTHGGIHSVYGTNDILWKASVSIKEAPQEITLSNELEQEYFQFAELYMTFNDDNKEHCEYCFQNNVGFDAPVEKAHEFVLSFLNEVLERHTPEEVLEEIPNAKGLIQEAIAKKEVVSSQKTSTNKDSDSNRETKTKSEKATKDVHDR